ncbi:hypothetical protein ETH_00004490 [Eimeria tenella]|uniref:Uncharacterized protein n=1 Tax=Eimeria tenella TaxID=5802 RepID=U6KN98_EIMTE|nr:hypothetical protein ETH_00004490 [Eimeria tenella]CDJ37767.1 hypothetical protein ETH_00004490 [Eimeria tenella]|eukprot:XP_013228605.1 hypothetical protein ETH_00004490 [Eimeria tenella]
MPTQAISLAGGLLLLIYLVTHLIRKVSFEMYFRTFFREVASMMQHPGGVQQLRWRALAFFGSWRDFAAPRHTAQVLGLILAAGGPDAKHEASRIASELAAVEAPLDAHFVKQIHGRRNGRAPPLQNKWTAAGAAAAAAAAAGLAEENSLKSRVLLVLAVAYWEAESFCRIVLNDPASCLLVLAI